MTTTEHHAIDLSDEQVEILDNLVWRSLTSTHARFAQGTGLARRFDPDVAGFVAVQQPTQCAWADLRRLVGPGALVMLSGGGDIDPPGRLAAHRRWLRQPDDPRSTRPGAGHRRHDPTADRGRRPADVGPRRTHPAGTVPTEDDRARRLLRGLRGRRTRSRWPASGCRRPSSPRSAPCAPTRRLAAAVSPRRCRIGSRPASSPAARRRSCTSPRPTSAPAVCTSASASSFAGNSSSSPSRPRPSARRIDPDCDEPGVDGVVKFIVIRLLTNPPDPDTGRRASATEVLGDAIEEASYFEELGFDGYGIGEHHIDDAEASSPAVILGYLAASTKRIRLFTGVTVLSLLDPVRVAEDYATVDVLSGGRVDLIIGKGNTEEQSKVFGYTNDDQWERNRENYELLHRLLREEQVTWNGDLPARARRVHVAPPPGPTADPRLARQRDVHPVDRPRRQVGRPAVLGERLRTARAVPDARRRLPQTVGRLRARPGRRARRRRLGRSARPS